MVKTKKEKSIEQMLDEALVKENEWPYRIPDNWVWAFLGKLGTFHAGSGFPKKFQGHENLPIPFFKVGTLKYANEYGVLAISDNYVDENIRKKIKAKIIPKGSIVFAKIGEAIKLNRRAIISIDSCIDNNMMAYDAYSKFLTNTLFYFWSLKEDFYQYSHATTVPSINKTKFEKMYFPLPPIKEQKKIVKKLSSMLDKLKEAKKLIQEAKDSIENRRASILNKAFTGELTKKWREDNPAIEDVRFYLENIENEIKKVAKKSKKEKGLIVEGYKIPNSWQWRKLDDLSFLITKGASPKWQGINYTNDKDQTLFVTSENVGSGHLILDKEKYVESKFDAKQKRSILKLGDVLLNIVGASIGRAAVFDIEKKSNINQAVALIRLADKKFNRFLNYLLNSEFAKNYYSQNKVDVARANLSLSDVANIPIPLPPLEEQKEIVRILDRILCKEDKSKELIDLEEHIDFLEKSILSKAFRGELGTNNPEDEPAIKLLEKALQSKKLTPAKPKTRRKGITGRQIISTSLGEFSENAQALLKDIKRLFGNTDFNTEKLRDKSNLPYEDFKNSLFELLESKLTMEFDENEEVITYQLKK
ncbi:MAG: restriction endonuclease subunit S [Desulfobacterales bacterium]|nr:restriction endonuclease subunit S [Desulfobacterales bacterium]